MNHDTFDALVIDKHDDGQTAALRSLTTDQLPEGDVLVDVAWSTLNYKDALALTGASPVVRKFPMVPGVDFSGIVAESTDPTYQPGDHVVLNGWGVGERHWGGLAGRARVKGEWLVPLPEGIDLRQAMGIGTAGYAAMLCVMALERHGIVPGSGTVLVTGAAGGVGSVAVALLSKLGYYVCAASGRSEELEYLSRLGAQSIIDREELSKPGRPLTSERWAAAIDTVGSVVLANVLSAMRYGGVVASVGLAGGMDLPTTVAPFILRGVTLAGVDSVMCPLTTRLKAWQRLARDLDFDKLESMVREVPMDEVLATAPQFLEGKVRGRLVVPVRPELAGR